MGIYLYVLHFHIFSYKIKHTRIIILHDDEYYYERLPAANVYNPKSFIKSHEYTFLELVGCCGTLYTYIRTLQNRKRATGI